LRNITTAIFRKFTSLRVSLRNIP